MPSVDYHQQFTALLESHRVAGTTVTPAALFAEPTLGSASDATKRSHLKKFLSNNPEFIGTVQGILPSVAAIINLAEGQLNTSVNESNVVQANRICAEIVGQAAGPVVEEFIRSNLAESLEGDRLSVDIRQLIDFLVGDFAAFTKGAGNGLISIAGSVNEKLLARCLESRGLTSADYSVTGTESQGDIIIHSRAGPRSNLHVEIKSYHARERLLRGLRDIERPKVGAGYFVDANEFNPTRTITLLQAQAAAIYMPQETLMELPSASSNETTNETIAHGSRFYRPLERFASDMFHFAGHGVLPPA